MTGEHRRLKADALAHFLDHRRDVIAGQAAILYFSVA